jgi:carboxyl-terminal processing protease
VPVMLTDHFNSLKICLKHLSIMPIALVSLSLAVVFSGCTLEMPNLNPLPAQQNQATAMYPEQGKARFLFLATLRELENEYADDTLNHQTLARWKKHYYDQIHTLDDAYIAIDSTIASLNDPYTRFFRPENFAEQNMAIASSLFGVGVEIAMVNESVTIMNIIPNSPAMASKALRLGDVITHINVKPIEGLSLMDVAKQIRGKKGTYVHLAVKQLDGKTRRLSIKRDEIRIEHVRLQPLEKHPTVAYIKLQSFMGVNVGKDFEKMLRQVANKPYLIVDLRNNAGGMLSNAVEIADMFLGDVPIVQVDGRGHKLDAILTGRSGVAYKGKVALLMNGGSASASEVLAGALQDSKRAILIGETSYGKGLVQQIIPLPEFESGLNVTVAHYLTPNGHNLNHVGLTPDVALSREQIYQAATKQQDLVLEKAVSLLTK